MREEELLKLESATRAVGIPLLIARSYGLMGYLRVRHAALHPCFYTPFTLHITSHSNSPAGSPLSADQTR